MDPVAWFPTLPEFDGLKASAVAVALTLFEVFPQMREKNVGIPERVTFTVTSGLTPKAVAANVVQSALEVIAPPLPPEYETLIVPGTELATVFWPTTACAACVARPEGPQICPQFPVALLGSPVIPETERTLAAASAAASAERCASSLSR